MQINKVQNSPSFQGWATHSVPKELKDAIKLTTKSRAKRVKSLELARSIAKDNLYSLEFKVDPNNAKNFSILANSGTKFVPNRTFKTGVFQNRDLHALLKKVNKFLVKEKKNVEQNSKMFDLNLNDSDFPIDELRKDPSLVANHKL